MKALLVLVFIPIFVHAQYQYWSPAIQITPDSVEALNPSFPENPRWWSPDQIQWLAYTRVDRDSMDIVVHRSTPRALSWATIPTRITRDTVHDDFSSFAMASSYSVQGPKMVVWQRGASDIYFSRSNDTIWSLPAPLGTGPSGGRTPNVAAADSGFIAVWEKDGRILVSESRNTNSWSTPIFLNGPVDTVNFLPRVKYFYGGSPYKYRPMVIWERRKSASWNREIAFAFRSDTGWTTPDTVASVGDNRRARFLAQGFSTIVVSFESNRLGRYSIFGASSSIGSLWSVDSEPSSGYYSDKNQTDASFTLFRIITNSPNETHWLWYTAGAWRIVRDSGEDSIGLVVRSNWTLTTRSAGSGEDKNPVLSTGVFNNGPLRVWCVWQNNATGAWRLVGSYSDILLDDVKEEGFANGFHLYQNYPNPFNPTTIIKYQIPPDFVGTNSRSGSVSLKAYDLLGREVATLVNEEKPSGEYEVTWEAGNLSSGVYFVRLSSGSFIQNIKAILVR